MALINAIIPPQNFEIVRDRVAAILTSEIANQFALSGVAEVNPKVWIERTAPIDQTEHPAVSVSLAEGNYSNGDAISVDGTYTFNIDVYTSGKATDDLRGEYRALVRTHRILGIIRAVLMHSAYRNLGAPHPFASTVRVTGFRVGEPNREQNTTNDVQSRLELEVRIAETNLTEAPRLLVGTLTDVRLSSTAKGYYYEAVLAVGNVYTGNKDFGTPLDVAEVLQGDELPWLPGADITATIGTLSPEFLWAAWPVAETGITGYYIDETNTEPFGPDSLYATPIQIGGFWYTQTNFPTETMTVTFRHETLIN